jgi:hypothetical protein
MLLNTAVHFQLQYAKPLEKMSCRYPQNAEPVFHAAPEIDTGRFPEIFCGAGHFPMSKPA